MCPRAPAIDGRSVTWRTETGSLETGNRTGLADCPECLRRETWYIRAYATRGPIIERDSRVIRACMCQAIENEICEIKPAGTAIVTRVPLHWVFQKWDGFSDASAYKWKWFSIISRLCIERWRTRRRSARKIPSWKILFACVNTFYTCMSICMYSRWLLSTARTCTRPVNVSNRNCFIVTIQGLIQK